MKRNLQLLNKTVSETSETGNGTYDFFYGDVTVMVTGDFGNLSVYCYNHGYMGGKNLLTYASVCIDINGHNSNNSVNNNTENNDDYFEFTIADNHSTSAGDIYYDSENGSMQNNLALLYKTVTETGETGNGDYDFYYGDVILTVTGDFGNLSSYCYNHGYMGGKDLLTYTEQCNSSNTLNQNNDDYFEFTISSDHGTSAGDIYYDSENGSMQSNLALMYKTVTETGETGNGDYDFYYGDVTVTVTGDFGNLSAYCYNHGYMGGKDLLTYTEQCNVNNTLLQNNNDYFEFTIANNHSTSVGDIYYDSENGSMQSNLALLYKTVTETDEPGNGDYDFYYGDVILTVTGDFGNLSAYCYNHGYMGGKNLLTYTEQCNVNNTLFQNNNDYFEFTIAHDHSTTAGDIYYDSENGSMQSNFSLMYKTVTETDEPGNGDYDFYYGDVTVTVTGDFGNLSAYCYYHGYMGGKDLLNYSDQCSTTLLSNSNDYYQFTIAQDHIVSSANLYYKTITNDVAPIHLLHKTITTSDSNESGNYDFYYGKININVSDNFDEMSVHLFNEGDVNGNTLLKYTNQCASSDIVEQNIIVQPSYNFFNLTIDPNHQIGNNVFYYQIEQKILTRVNMSFLYRDVFENNSNIDKRYDFYYGDIFINVNGDFGKVSVYNFDSGFLGTEEIFTFSEQCNIDAIKEEEEEQQDISDAEIEVVEEVVDTIIPYTLSSSSNDTSETNAQWLSRRVQNSQFFQQEQK